jgi:hypothetical protein
MKRVILGGVTLVLVVAWVAPAYAASKPAVDVLFPPRVFGHVQHALCATDRPGDFGFFNGKKPGRHDPFVDIRRACGATIGATPERVRQLETFLPCGPMPDGLVVCASDGTGSFFKPGGPGPGEEFVVFSMQVNGAIPLQIPSDQTGRYDIFIDAGGDPNTKFKRTAAAPDSASQGTNMTYQVVFNDPGTSTQGVDLFAVDHRQTHEFIMTGARVWFHGSGDVVTFVIPKSEIGTIKGIRGVAFRGSRTAQGDATLGDQKIIPGGAHVRGLIPYPG